MLFIYKNDEWTQYEELHWGGICVGRKVTFGPSVTVGDFLTFAKMAWPAESKSPEELYGVLGGSPDLHNREHAKPLNPSGKEVLLVGKIEAFVYPEDTPQVIQDAKLRKSLRECEELPEALRAGLRSAFGEDFTITEEPGIYIFAGGTPTSTRVFFGMGSALREAHQVAKVWGTSCCELDLSPKQRRSLKKAHPTFEKPNWHLVVERH